MIPYSVTDTKMQSTTSKRNVSKENELLAQLREMQQMEKETKETLATFLLTLNQRTTSQDYSSLLLEKIEELRRAEAENENKSKENILLQQQIHELSEKLEKSMAIQQKYLDDQIQLQNSLSESDKAIRKLEVQLQTQQRNHQHDLDQRISTLRSLENECSTAKAECEALQCRLEASELERTELHSAMSSLHGEITVLQSEISDGQEREKEVIRQRKELLNRLEGKEEEILRLKSEKGTLESKIVDLDRKLSEISDRTAIIQHEAGTRVDSLQRERDSVHGSLAKMSLKIKQQSQTLHELNSLLNRMRPELSTAVEGKAAAEAKVSELSIQLMQAKSSIASLENKRQELETSYIRAQQEIKGLTADLSTFKDKNAEILSENRKQANKIERLEKDKLDGTLDITGKSRELEALRQNYDACQILVEDLRSKIDIERHAKERALELNGNMESELERLRSDNREHQENVDSLARQLREADRMREQALEVSRNQQRENANRIVEFSQKNAKLSSELASLQDEIAGIKRIKEEAAHELRECQRERDEAKSNYSAIRARLQVLEDQYEEATARLESRKAEVEDLRSDIRAHVMAKEAALNSLKQEHDAFVQSLSKRLEEEHEEKIRASEKQHEQQVAALEKALQKAKDIHQQTIEELQSQRQRDASDAKSKLATVAKAMESLQGELRDEANKNKVLMQELTVLKDLAEVGSSEAQERLHYVERERLRDRARLEGQLADIKEQLRQQAEQKQQRDQLMTTIEQQLAREREARFAAMQRIRTLEDEASGSSSQIDNLTEENGALKKQLRDHERKLNLALAAKDVELQRLTRRNEVLGEAVTRLTSTQNSSISSGGFGTQLTPVASTSAVARYFTSFSSSSDELYSEDDAAQHCFENTQQDDTHSLAQSPTLTTFASKRPQSGSMTQSSNKGYVNMNSNLPSSRAKSAPLVRTSSNNNPTEQISSQEIEGNADVVNKVESWVHVRQDLENNIALERVGKLLRQSAERATRNDDTPLSPLPLPENANNDTNSCNSLHKRKSPIISLGVDVTSPSNSSQSPRSDGGGGSTSSFTLRVRNSVEKGKDTLLQYSPQPRAPRGDSTPFKSPPVTNDLEPHLALEFPHVEIKEGVCDVDMESTPVVDVQQQANLPSQVQMQGQRKILQKREGSRGPSSSSNKKDITLAKWKK